MKSLFFLGVLIAAACGGGAASQHAQSNTGLEGRYTLDKKQTKHAIEAEVDKMDPVEQPRARLALDMLDHLEMALVLAASGEATTETRYSGRDVPKIERSAWRQQGNDTVVITTTGSRDVTCTKRGTTLECAAQDTSDATPARMFFTRDMSR